MDGGVVEKGTKELISSLKLMLKRALTTRQFLGMMIICGLCYELGIVTDTDIYLLRVGWSRRV